MIKVDIGNIEWDGFRREINSVIFQTILDMQRAGASEGKISSVLDVKLNYIVDENATMQIIPFFKYKITGKPEHEKIKGIEGVINGQVSMQEIIEEQHE